MRGRYEFPSWLRCGDHQKGCSDRSECGRSLYESLLAHDVAPIFHHEVLGFLNIMELVDKAIDFHLAHDFQSKTCRWEHCLRIFSFHGSLRYDIFPISTEGCCRGPLPLLLSRPVLPDILY